MISKEIFKHYKKRLKADKKKIQNWDTMLIFLDKLKLENLSNVKVSISHDNLLLFLGEASEGKQIIVNTTLTKIGYVDITYRETFQIGDIIKHKTYGITCKIEKAMTSFNEVYSVYQNNFFGLNELDI